MCESTKSWSRECKTPTVLDRSSLIIYWTTDTEVPLVVPTAQKPYHSVAMEHGIILQLYIPHNKLPKIKKGF